MVVRQAQEVYTRFPMSWNASWILWPMLAHIGLVIFLYAWLTVARLRAVSSGEAEYSAFVLSRSEPREAARIRRNLSNQFELPLIFYAVAVLLIAVGRVGLVDIIAAWVFVFGRIAHTSVQTLTDNVPLRGQVFVINFLAVVVLAGHLLVLAIEGLVK
jgi:hypothetical protein